MAGNRRMGPRKTPAEIQELKALAHDPAAQSRLAASLLLPRKGLAVVESALAVLIEHPITEVRATLLELYAYYGEQATRDPACYLRSKIVLALRSVARPEDAPFFLAATATYVFPPPQFAEEGGLLRANALVVLNELDDALSRYAAARLLFDEYTAAMSGEPAVTAAQVLAGLEEYALLYAYVMQSSSNIVDEVGGQALRGLGRAAPSIVEQVLARYCNWEQEQDSPLPAPLAVGLFDLLLSLDPIPDRGMIYLEDFLERNSPLDLYHYLVTLLATCNLEQGWALLARTVAQENVPARRELLRQALDVALDPPRAAPLLALLARKRL